MLGEVRQPRARATWKQIAGTAVLCTVAAVVLGGGLFTWWLLTPPPMPQTTQEAADTLRSLRFHRLPAPRKLDYGHHIRDLLIAASEAERQAFFDRIGDMEALRAAIEDIQREALVRRARQYALADEQGRRMMIGEMFVEFMQMRSVMRGIEVPRSDEPPKTREERRAEFAGEIEAAAATGNPQDMQLIGELFTGIQRQLGGMLGGGRRPQQTPATPPADR